MQLKLTDRDLAYDPAAQAEAMRRLRAPVASVQRIFRPIVHILRPPRACRTIYMEPIGPTNTPGRKLYAHPIGPRCRDILTVSSKSLQPDPKAAFQAIFDEVCQKYGVRPLDVVSERRTKNLTLPRFEIYYRLKTETTMSFPSMAKHMGGRDHTSAMNGFRKYEKLLAEGKVRL